MFPAENIRDWRGHKVVDSRGSKIGELEAIYVDTASDEPAFATVKVGVLGRSRLIFVPLHDAVVAPGYLKVAVTKAQTKTAPSIGTDGELFSEMEPEVFTHYEIPYRPGTGGERRLARR